jgi:integrase
MNDMRYLTKRGGANLHAIIGVPRKLRPILGKSHLLESLHTADPVVARAKRHAVLAKFQAIIDAAQRQHGAGEVVGAAIEWREHIRRLKQGDITHVWDSRYPEGGEPLRQAALYHAATMVEEDASEVAGKYGPATATAFLGIATGRATPLTLHVEDWLREGGAKGPLNIRTRNQYRSAVQQFGEWCKQASVPPTIEAISKDVAGRYVTECFIALGADPATSNKHITSLSSYWKWLAKRTSITVNPWEGQSRSKASARNGTDRKKRPFTDQELLTLLHGDADQELADLIRVAALSGMRLEEVYRLQVGHCAHGVFNIRAAKTAAGVRAVPIHSDLADIVERRTAGKPATAYLFHEPGALKPGRERSMAISKRFGRYRIGLGVEDRAEGRRHSRVDFHSLRRWFITRARNADIDQATVAAVVGHAAGNLADDVYSSGPEMTQRRACVEAVKLPV